MEITETVLIAIITFASGAIGAIAGVVGGVASSKIRAKAQIEQIVVQERFKARTSAYQQVFETHLAMVKNDFEVPSVGNFMQAIHNACVVASAETSARLMLLQETADQKVPSEIQRTALTEALIAMQKDLDNFTAPRIRRNMWPKK